MSKIYHNRFSLASRFKGSLYSVPLASKLRLHLPDDESDLHLPAAAGRAAPAAAHRVPRVVPDPGPGGVTLPRLPHHAVNHPRHLQQRHNGNLTGQNCMLLTVAEFMVCSASRTLSSMSQRPLPPAWARTRPIIVTTIKRGRRVVIIFGILNWSD